MWLKELAALWLGLSFWIPPLEREAVETALAHQQEAQDALEKAQALLSAKRAQSEAADAALIISWHPDILNKEAVQKALHNDPLARKHFLEISRLRAAIKLSANSDNRQEAEAAQRRLVEIQPHEEALRRLIREAEAALAFKKANVAPNVANATRLLADKLKAHPAKPSNYVSRLGIYLLDLDKNDVTLIADEPDKDFSYLGSPEWTATGKRITFDAIPYPGNKFSDTHIKTIELSGDNLAFNDLGPGNCPTNTPDADRVVFLLNPGAVQGAEAGVWIMEGDGKDRRPLCQYGRPKLSLDGRQLMISSFSNPYLVTIIDVASGEQHVLKFENHDIISIPAWAEKGTIITVVRGGLGESIVMLDVTNPEQARLKDVIWTRGDGSDIEPAHPTYSPVTGLCAFRGWSPRGISLYSIARGETGPPKQLKAVGQQLTVAAPTFSPDGRFLLFCSDAPNAESKRK